jgi:hypothetical protein
MNATPHRFPFGAVLLAALSTLALTGLTGCGGDKSQSTVPQRPITTARIQILEPTPNQVTGPDLTVKVDLKGAKEVQPAQGTVKPDEGHIHIVLDGQVVAMAYGTQQDLHGLKPGQHALQADFVAIDHLPFQNRVTAAVIFTVKQ